MFSWRNQIIKWQANKYEILDINDKNKEGSDSGDFFFQGWAETLESVNWAYGKIHFRWSKY